MTHHMAGSSGSSLRGLSVVSLVSPARDSDSDVGVLASTLQPASQASSAVASSSHSLGRRRRSCCLAGGFAPVVLRWPSRSVSCWYDVWGVVDEVPGAGTVSASFCPQPAQEIGALLQQHCMAAMAKHVHDHGTGHHDARHGRGFQACQQLMRDADGTPTWPMEGAGRFLIRPLKSLGRGSLK